MKVRLIFLCISLIIHCTYSSADIPFAQSKGVLTYTKDEYKHISPFWGIVAINSKLLPGLRFFWNYKDIKKDNREIERGDDDIAELIRELFRSPDGIQFVATNYFFEPAGDLSRHLDKINDIIQILVEPEAQKVNKNQEKISQLSALIKTKKAELTEISSKLKEIKDETSEERMKLEKESLNINAEIKSITGEIRKLNLPDPRIKEKTDLLAKIRSLEAQNKKKADPILQTQIAQHKTKLTSIETALEQEKGMSKVDRLIQVLEGASSLHDATDEMLIEEARSILRKKVTTSQVAAFLEDQRKQQSQEKEVGLQDQVDWAESLQAAAESMIANAPERAVALVEDREVDISSPDKARALISPMYQDKIRQFATLLLKAYDAQKVLANPQRTDVPLMYPENIVVISLLAFFAKTADSKEALKKLPFLMKEGDDLYKIEPYNKNDFEKQTPTRELIENNPEEAFLYSRWYDQYDSPIISPFSYRGGTTYRNEEFPDCGESSLRYVLLSLLAMGNSGIIDSKSIENFEENLKKLNPGLDFSNHQPYQKLKKYIINNGDLSLASNIAAHDAWAEVVSNLNNLQAQPTINDVQYGRGPEGNGLYTYELKSNFDKRLFEGVQGIVNMFNMIGKLIPDNVLNEPWNPDREIRLEQLAGKLDRLCALLSKDDMILEWSVANGEEISEITQIDFSINGTPVIRWFFDNGHFYPDRIATAQSDPRLAFNEPLSFPNIWIASMYLKYSRDWDKKSIIPNMILPIVFSEDFRTVQGNSGRLKFLLQKYPAYLKFSPRWVKKIFPTNDSYGMRQLSEFLGKLYSSQEVPHMDQIKLAFRPLYKIFKSNSNENLLFFAIKNNDIELTKELLAAGLDVNAQNRLGETPIFKVTSSDALKLLLNAGGDLLVKDKKGKTAIDEWLKEKSRYHLLAIPLFKGIIDPNTPRNDYTLFSTWLSSTDFGDPEMVKIYLDIVNRPGVNAVNFDYSPLLDIMYKMKEVPEDKKEGWMTVINDLINRSDMLKMYKNGTLLHQAIGNGYVTFIPQLIARGADVNQRDPLGRTSLGLVNLTKKESLEIIKLLVKAGADINEKKAHGYTLMHKVLTIQQAEVLFDLGAKIDIVNNAGNTPFQIVAMDFNSESFHSFNKDRNPEGFIDFFISHGANPYHKNEKYDDVLDIIRQAYYLEPYQKDQLIDHIKSSYAKAHPELASASEKP